MDRLARLEKLVAELQEQLEPQAIRSALEKTWNPRGTADEIRIQGASGVPLKLRKNIQFIGSTPVDDPAGKRTVVTTATPTKEFSADDTVGSTEQVEFLRPADGVRQASLKTRTQNAGALKEVWLANANDGVTVGAGTSGGQAGRRAYVRLRTWTAGGQEANLIAGGGDNDANTCRVDLVSDDGINTSTSTLVSDRAEATGAADVVLKAVTPAQEARLTGNCNTGAVLTSWTMSVSAGGIASWPIMTEVRQSHFIQYAGPIGGSGVNGAGRRVLRGPYKLAVPILAPAAAFTAATVGVPLAAPENTINGVDARYGVDYLVLGGVKGAAGAETVVWSYVDGPGAAEFTVNATNVGLVPTPACVIYLYTICLQ